MALVVVPRIYDTCIWQGEHLRVDALVQHASVTLLEVGPAAAPDEECVACKACNSIVEYIRHSHTPACVPGSRANLKRVLWLIRFLFTLF